MWTANPKLKSTSKPVTISPHDSCHHWYSCWSATPQRTQPLRYPLSLSIRVQSPLISSLNVSIYMHCSPNRGSDKMWKVRAIQGFKKSWNIKQNSICLLNVIMTNSTGILYMGNVRRINKMLRLWILKFTRSLFHCKLDIWHLILFQVIAKSCIYTIYQ